MKKEVAAEKKGDAMEVDEVERPKEKPRRLERAPSAGPSKVAGTEVDEESGFVPGRTIQGEVIPYRYVKHWDFGALGEDGRVALLAVQSRKRELLAQFGVMRTELKVIMEMEEGMLGARKELGEEKFFGEFVERAGELEDLGME